MAMLDVKHHSNEVAWRGYGAEMKLPVSHAACVLPCVSTAGKSPSALFQLCLKLGVIEFCVIRDKAG